MFPSYGSVQSEPGGWTNLIPHTGTPLPGTRVVTEFLIRIYDIYGPPQEGWGLPPLFPLSRCMLNLMVRQHQLFRDLSYALDPSLLSASYTHPPISCLVCGMADKPYSLSVAYQRGFQVRPMHVAASPVLLMRQVHHRHRCMTPSPVLTVQVPLSPLIIVI